MVINLRVQSMKSEPPGSGRQPIESGPVPGPRDMSLTNGGDRNASDVVLRQVSFYHDHISCTKAADLLEPMPCETDHLYAHCGDEVPEDSEQDRLRAVIVIHTDLIQHQQELIAERDRQIDELRAQRDALQDLLQQQQQRRLQCLAVSVGCQTDWLEAPQTAPAPLLPCEVQEEPRVEEEEEEQQLPCRPSSRPSSPQPEPRHEPSAASREEEAGQQAPPAESGQEPAAPPPAGEPSSRKRSVAVRDEPSSGLLPTDQPYACLPRPEVEPAPEAIEVPTWRVNPVASAYSMEGTENLDDEVYNRRHHKLEVDERRRKRWDMQALREQKRLERLRRRMEPEAEKPPTCPHTFCGSPRHVQVIEVVECLPVAAFGQPLPHLEPTDFSLPWFHPSRPGEDQLAAKGRKRSSLGARWR